MKLVNGIKIAARAAVCVYGGGIALFLILRAVVGDRFLPTMIFDMAVPSILFPGLVLLIFYALTRHWRMAAIQLPALVCFLGMYGHILFVPAEVQTVPTGTQISVLTYNISLGRRHVDQRIALIRDANADVVALQEVSESSAELID